MRVEIFQRTAESNDSGKRTIEPVIDKLVEFLLCPGSRAVASEGIQNKHLGFGDALVYFAELQRILWGIA